MNPQEIFCPNIECPARGQVNAGNIKRHSLKEKRYSCEVCQLRARLLERGKAKMVIVGAAMPKLLHLAYGILKHQLPFDPNWV